MDNPYNVEEQVRKWIEDSQKCGQNVEVQIRNTITDMVVHTTMDPLFVLGICGFTNVSKY